MRCFLVLALAASSACRPKPLATADFDAKASSVEVHFASTGKPVDLWWDSAGVYDGSAGLPVKLDVELLANGATVAKLACATDDVAATRTCTSHHNEQFKAVRFEACTAKLTCAVPALPSGDITLRATAKPGPEVQRLDRLLLLVRERQ